MEMYIDTHTKEKMEHSICEYLGITTDDLGELFQKISIEAQSDGYFNGYKSREIVKKYISNHNTGAIINEVLFFHLARRLNSGIDDPTGYNLKELLTTQTVLSLFLKKHGVEFYEVENHLELYYKGEKISLDDTYLSHVPYLRARLGYNKGREDYCFNGFAFKDLLYRNAYARELEDVPEFVGTLATFLQNKMIGTDYYHNSTYYCYEYRVPLEKIMFDDNEKLQLNEKRQYLLYQVIYRLYEYAGTSIRYMFDHDNPILRLADTDTMEPQFFAVKEVITDDMLQF